MVTEAARGPGLPIEPHLGIRASLSWVTFHGDDSDNQSSDSSFKLRKTPSFGIAAGILSTDDFLRWRGGLLLDASYMTKGSAITIDGEEVASFDLRYYDFALLAQLERDIDKGFRGYLLGGPGLSILRDAQIVDASGEDDRTSYTTDGDWRIVAGVGVRWAFRPNHHLTFDVRTDVGTKTIDATINNSEVKNLAISLSLGYQWSYPPRPARANAPCPEP